MRLLKHFLDDFNSFGLATRHYLVMHVLGSVTMIGYCVYPVYLRELGIGIVGVGLLYAIADVTKSVLTYSAGRWLDRVGARTGIVLDWLISGVSVLIYAVSSRFWHFVGGELVERFSALFNPGFAAYENDAFDADYCTFSMMQMRLFLASSAQSCFPAINWN